jgi:hypothetical protein
MSSRVTIDDLLGKVTIKTENGAEKLQFTKQPFTEAFEKGYWLMLDELNLAPDNVLQAIEEALDTDMLKLHDSSEASEHVVTINKHPDFRLFATQNPNTGFFKGKRETLSASFLTRFQPLVYTELPEEDLRLVLQGRLAGTRTADGDGSSLMDTPQNLKWLADLMVKFHFTLKGAMHTTQVCAHASDVRSVMCVCMCLCRPKPLRYVCWCELECACVSVHPLLVRLRVLNPLTCMLGNLVVHVCEVQVHTSGEWYFYTRMLTSLAVGLGVRGALHLGLREMPASLDGSWMDPLITCQCRLALCRRFRK